MKQFELKRLNTQETYIVEMEDSFLRIKNLKEECSLGFQVGLNAITTDKANLSETLLQVVAEVLFSHHPEIEIVQIGNDTLDRVSFFSTPELWNISNQSETYEYPSRYPFSPGQKLYNRYVNSIEATIELRVIAESDLETFHQWHNQPRVSNFWELAQSKDELLNYIQKGLKDPHQIPVIAEINGEPAGYFEIYWTKEDRLGPYYESGPYDRGFHLLVGNPKYLGFKNTDALLKSACHFIYLDDSRTASIMGEPRHDNQKLLRYLLSFKSWRRVKEFDFPHKRAVLLECDRTLFFQGHYL